MKDLKVNIETLEKIEAPSSHGLWFGAGLIVGGIIILT